MGSGTSKRSRGGPSQRIGVVTLIVVVLLTGLMVGIAARGRGRQAAQRRLIERITTSGDEVRTAPYSLPGGLAPGLVGRVLGNFVYSIDAYRTEFTDEDIEALNGMSGLVHLWIQNGSITDKQLLALRSLPRLENLCIHSPKVTNAGLTNLPRLPSLRYLHLSGPAQIDDAGVTQLAAMKQLTWLHLYSGLITDRVGEPVGQMDQLTSVRLGGERLTGGLLPRLIHDLPNLGSLTLWARSGFDGGLAQASPSAGLTGLVLYGEVTDAGIEHLAKFPNLAYLGLATQSMTERGASRLGTYATLEWLSLSGSNLTDDGLAYLAKLPKLKTLYLMGTKLTDSGLSHLSGMATLESLLLYDTPITDAGIEHLTRLWRLNYIGLPDGVSREAGRKLREAIPGLEHVEWKRLPAQSESE